jgi:isopenicillin N synthase-like dioxygenase
VNQAIDKASKGYFVGREIPGNKPPYRPFQEANIWPPQIPEAQFRQPLIEYHRALSDLSFHLMRILARGLRDFDTTVFEGFCRDPIAAVRLLHYPPHPDAEDATLVGAGAHTDFGAITLLLQDGHSGLQVLNQFTKEWIDVPPREHAYVVNVGDMLEAWTSGAYKSNVHRVINTSGTDRYSVPFFLDGNADCVIRPLDGSVGKAFTVEEHMLSRYAATY